MESKLTKHKIQITGVAIKQDGQVYSMARPARHSDLIEHLITNVGLKAPIDGEQGFLLHDGRYLSRKDACDWALLAGQISKKKGLELQSEDLW